MTFRYPPDNVPDLPIGLVVRYILAESQVASPIITRIKMSFGA